MAARAKGTAKTESTAWSDALPRDGIEALKTVESGITAAGQGAWSFFHALPLHGAALGGAVGLGVAMTVGVAELVTAGFSAYVTYRMFAYGESFLEAIEKTIKFEQGRLSEKEIERRTSK